MRLKEIAALVEGYLVGDPEAEVTRCASLDHAGPGTIVFVEEQRFIAKIGPGRPSCIIKAAEVHIEGGNTIEVERPAAAFAKVMDLLHPPKKLPAEIHPAAMVHQWATVGEGCHIAAGAGIGARSVIGNNVVIHRSVAIAENVAIGDDCVIHPNVTIYPDTIIGRRTIIHAGAVIGADGFKYYVDEHGVRVKVRHIGKVRIGDDVEIGANSCIDRAMLDSTLIGNGVKLDNLVQVGHNCIIGDNTVIAAGCGIAGSVVIGRNVTIGGQVGIADHVTIADNTFLAGKSGVASDIGPGVFGGSYAMPINEWRRAEAAYRRGPEMLKRLAALEKKEE